MRRPISLDILRDICLVTPKVCNSEYEAILLHSAFVLIFFAALRISEMVPANKKGNSGLLFNEVLISPGKVQVFISRSKTDVHGRGNWLSLYACGDSIICPYVTLSTYISIRPSCSGNFLVHLDHSPLTKFQFSVLLRRCLSHLGLSHLKFSSHSFRIGAATEAARLGLEDTVIMKLGRWESKRFNLYVRPNLCL